MIRRAFTIVEMLVVLGFVALVTAILIVSLRSVRGQALDLQNLTRLRATAIDFAAWGADHKSQIVNAGLPEDPSADWFYGIDRPMDMRRSIYTSQIITWPRVLERWLGHSQEHWHAVAGSYPLGDRGPESRNPDAQHPTRFILGETLLTKADWWIFPNHAVGIETYYNQQHVVRFDDVAFPATKGLIIHSMSAGAPEWRDVAMCDGSAARRLSADALPMATPPGAADPNVRGAVVRHTLHGFRGRDFP